MKKTLFALMFCVLSTNFASALIGQGYDGNAPTISITSPTQNQTFAFGTTSITLTYTATDEGGSISKYWVKIDSNSWIDNALNTTYTFTDLNAGSHILYAIATDDSDNNSETASVSISISSTPPITCGDGTCDSGEDSINCPADCQQPSTCSSLGGSVCSNLQNCSGSIISTFDTNSCCIGSCVAKTCTELGGIICDINANDCTAWINQSTNCCLASACIPKPTQTILCSFPNYLATEPITAVFIEPSNLASNYNFKTLGTSVTITPNVSNTLADTIVTSYPNLYLVSANLTGIPEMTPEQAYVLELLKSNSLFGSSIYSAKPEDFQQIYSLMSASRLRWWNARQDDTCEPKLKPSELGISLQTMHYFRINNLWLLWYEKARKK